LIINNDQREKRRFKYEAVIWHDNILPDRFYAARICNISRSGLYFESDQTLYQGEEIYIAHQDPGPAGINPENCTRVEIKWRQNLQNSAYRYGYGAKFRASDNPLVKSIDKNKLISQNMQDNHAGYKNEPRAHLREFYRKEIVFIAENTEYKGLVTDISRGGAFIQTKTKLSLGQMINLYIQGGQSCKDVNIMGWVVRLSPNGIGVKFDRRLRGDRRKHADRRERRADSKKEGS
jgi:Tfp pilus assembly protein PilZ